MESRTLTLNLNAPIVLFTYKRLDTLIETMDFLRQNKLALESELFIFSDGAKNQLDKEDVDNVRLFLKTIQGFKQVTIFESPTNKGLANSVIAGVTQIVNMYGKVIVLEDDLETTPNFLQFMNQALANYDDSKEVFSISGYSFNLGVASNEKFDSYFLKRGWSWGWATWKDRWEGIDWKVKTYNEFVNNRTARKEFSKGGSDLNGMLDDQINKNIDSWAIRWFYHQFLIKGLTVYPILSKVTNIGFGEAATHTKGSNKRYIPMLDTTRTELFKFPVVGEKSEFYHKQFEKKMSLLSRLISKLETIFNL